MALFVESIIFLVMIYFVIKNKFDKFVAQYDGLPKDPLVTVLGHCVPFMFKTPAEILTYGIATVKRMGGTALFVMGFNARVFITDPQDVEEILSNRKFSVKSDFYDLFRDWLADGVLLSRGQKCTERRKILLKSFHFKILEDFVEIFDKNSSILIKTLGQFEGKVIDVFPKIGHCALDIICETAMGVEINVQSNSESNYAKAVQQIGEVIATRFFNIFLQNKLIFRLSPTYQKQKQCLKVLHDFTDSVIEARRKELLDKMSFGEKIEDESIEIDKNKKLALLDVLLQATVDGEPLSNLDIREEVDTFMFAGQDTTTSAIAFCLYNLAKHPEIQNKVRDEVRTVFGDDVEKPMTPNELKELNYLELVIKETLRMYPSVPLFGREAQEDVTINGKFIPKNTNLIIAAVIMGRMESIWGDPLAFRPERFLEESSSKRNPFAMVPFSAGPRNCIGQKYAMMQMKTLISKILRNFEVHVPSDYEPVLLAEMVLRPQNGMMLEFRKLQTS